MSTWTLEDNGSFGSIVNLPDLVRDEEDLVHVVADVDVLNHLVIPSVVIVLEQFGKKESQNLKGTDKNFIFLKIWQMH